jgi:hypothetical protein
MTELALFPKNPTAESYEYELDDGFQVSIIQHTNAMQIRYTGKVKYVFDLSMFEVIEFSEPVAFSYE